ncbi:carboxypeptidase regulatory-like domain-containing protein [candidate division KSB1 bacterium]|nr:carboxypeptidase regulatory-like domain-containing protein [candidate division KSB1 bacterium]
MKHRYSLLILCILLGTTRLYAQAPPVVYYPFNGNAENAIANRNHGQVYGPVLTEDRFGNPNSAYQFDGVDDYILAPASPYLNFYLSNFTITAWVKISEVGNGFYTIIEKMDRFMAGLEPGYSTRISTLVSGYVSDGISSAEARSGLMTLSDDIWHFIVFRFSRNSNLELFVDGVLVGSTTMSQVGVFDNSSPMTIGKRLDDRHFFNGAIDDIRIFNFGLTNDQIFAYYHENGWPNDPPVAAFHSMIVSANENCEAIVTPQQLDTGSYDPDDDPMTYTMIPEGPFPLGSTDVLIIISDVEGLADSAYVTITVEGGSGTITGNVSSMDVGLNYVTVDVSEVNAPTMPIASCQTNELGQYSFDNVPAAEYIVTVTAPTGYEVTYNDVLQQITCGMTATVNFTLEKLNNPPVAAARSVSITLDNTCEATVHPDEFDAGSCDPDGDAITLSVIPAGPYFPGTTDVLFVVTDGSNAADSANVSITVLGGKGAISGTVSSNDCGIAGVEVFLIDDQDSEILTLSRLSDNSGYYEFIDVPVGEYQVALIEPIGFAVQEDSIVQAISCGSESTIDFQLDKTISKNQARNRIYWYLQFEQSKCQRGKKDKRNTDVLSGYIREIHKRYTTQFPIFADATSLKDWQKILKYGCKNNIRAKAEAQLATLLFNIFSQRLGQYEIVTKDGLTAGDVLTFVSRILMDNQSDRATLKQAQKAARWVNLRKKIPAGFITAEQHALFKQSQAMESATENPEKFELNQNYPNPFNASTTITYALPTDDMVKITVFDMNGRIIGTLCNDFMTAGYHSLQWHAENIPSGVYFYEVAISQFRERKKLTLMK